MLCCPECGSSNLIHFGTKFHKASTGKREKIPQYQCKDCGRLTVKPVDTPKENEE